jgi:hypothetical protein
MVAPSHDPATAMAADAEGCAIVLVKPQRRGPMLTGIPALGQGFIWHAMPSKGLLFRLVPVWFTGGGADGQNATTAGHGKKTVAAGGS